MHIRYPFGDELNSAMIFGSGFTYSAELAICVVKSVFDFLFLYLVLLVHMNSMLDEESEEEKKS